MEDLKQYVKNENIIGYLSYELDGAKLLDYIDKDKFEEQEGWNEFIETEEDYIYQFIDEYNYIKAVENEDIKYLVRLIYGCEFDIEINDEGKINLIDLQGAYLGGAETYEGFENIENAVNRLSGTYFYDYYGIEIN